MATGTTSINFGASHVNDASVAVAQPTVVLGTFVEAYLVPVATADHSADEHLIAASTLEIIAGPAVAGVGFTIYGVDNTPGGQYGLYTVAWVWV